MDDTNHNGGTKDIHEWLRGRIFDAIDLRTILIPSGDNAGRLIHGDGDNIQGLIVDLYDENLLVEITNSAMWKLKDEIISTLSEALEPAGMLIKDKRNLRVDNTGNPSDRIKKTENIVHGEKPSRQTISIGGLLYSVDLMRDTIHFFDQNDNRHSFGQMVEGYTVLDTFCYSGAWGLEAAKGRAREVTFIDSDANALELTEFNWKLNNEGEGFSTVLSKTLPFLEQCLKKNRKFDAIVIDPPVTLDSFDEIELLNQTAIEVLHKGGLLVSSCYLPQVTFDRFSVMIGKGATKAKRFAKVVKFGHQSSSFTVAANFPESAYLKCLFARIY